MDFGIVDEQTREYQCGITQRVASVASGLVAVTGVGFTPKALYCVTADVSGGYDSFHCSFTSDLGNPGSPPPSSSAYNKRAGVLDDWLTSDQFSYWSETAGNAVSTRIETWDSDGFTLNILKIGSPTQTYSMRWCAFR